MEERKTIFSCNWLVLGVSVNILVGLFCLLLDRFFSSTSDAGNSVHIGGTISLLVLSIVTLYLYIFMLTGVRSSSFYLCFVPAFLTSCLDSVILIEFARSPNDTIFPNLIHAGDIIFESGWAQIGLSTHALVSHPLAYLMLHRISKGGEWRTFFIFDSSFLIVQFIPFMAAFLTLPSEKIHSISKMFIVYPPLLLLWIITALKQPRSFTLNSNGQSTMTKLTITLLQILSLLVLTTKCLVGFGFSSINLKTIDPMLLHKGISQAVEPGVAHMWTYAFFIIPTTFISLVYMWQPVKQRNPGFLWDLAVAQLATIVHGQFYYIIGALHWSTPNELKVSGNNIGLCLIFNLIPLASSVINLSYLSLNASQHQKIRKKIH